MSAPRKKCPHGTFLPLFTPFLPTTVAWLRSFIVGWVELNGEPREKFANGFTFPFDSAWYWPYTELLFSPIAAFETSHGHVLLVREIKQT